MPIYARLFLFAVQLCALIVASLISFMVAGWALHLTGHTGTAAGVFCTILWLAARSFQAFETEWREQTPMR